MTDLPQSVPQIVIMISSTRADLMPYREEASRVIKKVAADCERRDQLVEKTMEREDQRCGMAAAKAAQSSGNTSGRP
jgi:hypothetical protein